MDKGVHHAAYAGIIGRAPDERFSGGGERDFLPNPLMTPDFPNLRHRGPARKGGVAVKRALIVTSGGKSAEGLMELLRAADIPETVTVSSAAEAVRRAKEGAFDLCVINAPLPDADGPDLAACLARDGGAEVLLLVRADQLEAAAREMEPHGVLTLAKPIGRALFRGAVLLARAAHARLSMIQRENAKLLQKIEDIRLIDRAKLCLISYLSMTEPEAHRYMEKQAMDMRMTRRAVAEEILKTYES